MEGHERKKIFEIATANQSMPGGTLALKNFTIPRKKRVSGQVQLEPCPEESRDYTLIQSKLKESRLDMRKEHTNDWLWKDIKLVHNEEFLREFSDKRSEMRAKGRHGREMEERYCFLVASYEETNQIYQFGLKTGRQEQYSLGKPLHGVYLFKHVDVAVKHASGSTLNGKRLLVFKVLFGKVKKLTPSLEWNKTVDPMIAFDSHMAKEAFSHRDSLSQQVLGSFVYLFDYNEKQELNPRPRQCLPYAVVSFEFIKAAMPISPPVSPTKPLTGFFQGSMERLKGCTVAKRRGKGENATVTFEHFTTPGSTEQEHPSPVSGADATPFQLQSSPSFTPPQPYVPLTQPTEHCNPSAASFENGVHCTSDAAPSSDVQTPCSTVKCESHTETFEETAQASAEKISTIVYSSRLVKDPRLSRPGTTDEAKSSETQKTSGITHCDESSRQTQSPHREEMNKITGSHENNPVPSSNDPHKSDSVPEEKTGHMVPFRFYKLKFQKHTLNKTPNEMSKPKLLPKPDNNCTLSQAEPLNNEKDMSIQTSDTLLTDKNICETNTSSMTGSAKSAGLDESTPEIEDTTQHQSDSSNTSSNQITHINTESEQVKETEPLLDSQHYGKDVENRVPEQGFLASNVTEMSQTLEKCDPPDASSELQVFNIAAMDVASCVDISVVDVQENSDDLSVSAVFSKDKESLAPFHSDINPEMAIEVERGEAQQHNTTYYSLYKRLQLDQLLSSSDEANHLSSKSYLRPKGADTGPDNHINGTDDLQVIFKIQSRQASQTSERLTLSDRFSKLRGCNENLRAFSHLKRLAKNYTSYLNRDKKCDLEAVESSNERRESIECDNVKLIQLMAQRYEEDKILKNGRRLRNKRFKMFGRRKSNSTLSKISSNQLLFQVMRRAVHTRNRHLLKKKRTSKGNVASKLAGEEVSGLSSASSNCLSCIETESDPKANDPELNSGIVSESEAQSQPHILSSEEDPATCPSSPIGESKISGEDGNQEKETGESREQSDSCLEQSTRVLNANDELPRNRIHRKSKTLKKGDSRKDLKIKTPTKSLNRQKRTNLNRKAKSKKVTLVGEKAEKESSKLPTRLTRASARRLREGSCEKSETLKDMEKPVSNISGDGSADEIPTSTTSEGPSLINDEVASDTKTLILDAGVSEHLTSEEIMESPCTIERHQAQSDTKSIDANDKDESVPEQSNLNAAVHVTNDVTKPHLKNASFSNPNLQIQSINEIPKINCAVNLWVEPSKDTNSIAANDLSMMDNLHLAWQGQDQNNVTMTTEKLIISRLRDYVTRFETEAEKKDSIDESVREGPSPIAWITLDSTVPKHLLEMRHYNKQALADPSGPAVKHKQTDDHGLSTSWAAKRQKPNKAEDLSPDVIFVEATREKSHASLLPPSDLQPLQIPSAVPNMNYWLPNHGTAMHHNHGATLQQNNLQCIITSDGIKCNAPLLYNALQQNNEIASNPNNASQRNHALHHNPGNALQHGHGNAIQQNYALQKNYAAQKSPTLQQNHGNPPQQYHSLSQNHRNALHQHHPTPQNHGNALQQHYPQTQNHENVLQKNPSPLNHGNVLLQHHPPSQKQGNVPQKNPSPHNHGNTLQQQHHPSAQNHVNVLQKNPSPQNHGNVLLLNHPPTQNHGNVLLLQHPPTQTHGNALQRNPSPQNHGNALQQQHPPPQNHGNALQRNPSPQNHGNALQQHHPPLQNHGNALQKNPSPQNHGNVLLLQHPPSQNHGNVLLLQHPPTQTHGIALQKNLSLQNHGNALQQHHPPPPQNHGNVPQKNQVISTQAPGSITCSGVGHSVPEKTNAVSELTPHHKKEQLTCLKKCYSVTDIASILKLADHAVSLVELRPLQGKCKEMLEYFISNFERDLNISFDQSCISRKLILDKYLGQPPAPIELKFESINSFLEIQMMVEAWHFVENKINFLRKIPRFRSLLWYDPSLYGELYKGVVGFQQQSSLFSSFQQCLAMEDFSKLQEYHSAVATLHQQLQEAPDTSYYMYLKTKRERLEVEAVLGNSQDVKSFFLSVPVAMMMNLGNTLESLEKVQNVVTRFIETPADQLPGIFDVGKAEHLSIICRYLQEKAVFLKTTKDISKVSWFGLEHLLYDASKVLVWNESAHGQPNEVLKNSKRANPQVICGVSDAGTALIKKMDKPTPPQSMEGAQTATTPQEKELTRSSKPATSSEKTHTALNTQNQDGHKETHQSANKRATCPSARLNFGDGAATPIIQPNLSAPLGNPGPYTDFSHRSSAIPWRTPQNHLWDWTPRPSFNQELRSLLFSKGKMTTPLVEPRTAPVPDHQTAQAVRQQPPPPIIVKPKPERISLQPIRPSHHAEFSKEQANKFTRPIIKPLPLQSYPTPLGMPPPFAPLPFSNTSAPLHSNPTPISYPYLLLNEQTFSNAGSSLPVPVLHAETQYHPHPV